MAAGDVFIVETPGGGGYGDPLERNLEWVQEDLRSGRVYRETAERDYGAVFLGDSTVLDIPATEARRKKLASK